MGKIRGYNSARHDRDYSGRSRYEIRHDKSHRGLGIYRNRARFSACAGVFVSYILSRASALALMLNIRIAREHL